MSIIRGALIGGFILFVWGLIAWRALPFKPAENHFKNASSVARVLEDNVAQDGVYVLWPQKTLQEEQKGPYLFGVVRLQGKQSLSITMITALVSLVIASGFASWMLLQTKGLKYGRKVLFVTVVGIIVSICGEFRYFNWAGFPLTFTLLGFVDIIIGWFLAGLVLAKVVRHSPREI